MKTKTNLVFHPFLFAIYPTLYILAANLKQVSVVQSIRPLLISLALATVLFFLLRVVSKNFQQGAISASLILALFFSYGHVHRFLESAISQTISHIALGSLWLVFLFLGIALKWKIRDLYAFTNTLNLISALLLVLPAFQIIIYLIQPGKDGNVDQLPSLKDSSPLTVSSHIDNTLPDIYYIILDGYGRSDILQEIYDYDNSQFISFLEDKGFVIATDSHSNYAYTTLSLASSLNMDYINSIGGGISEDYQSLEPTAEMIRHSRLRAFLKEHGYQSVAFQTGSGHTMIPDADYYITYRPNIVNDLEGLLITSSALRMYGERLNNLFSPFSCIGHQGSIHNIFTNLAVIPYMSGPQFVFAHIMSPHPPFIFGPKGDLTVRGECNGFDGSLFTGTPDEYRNGYQGQVEYISLLMQDAVEKILARSDIPPIIIIQGDHGSGLLLDSSSSANTCIRERFSILNAYYLPNGGGENLYQTVTPVNSFRIILNHYFEAGLPLLDDRLYYSSLKHYYKFENVTGRIETPCR
ncbi:MAG: sulfatase-like hydrolase/transferase [Chloroflexi bacterium]|nr:sulfatase-like hydrolase/transferase [Chloroflexota bacterium]